MPVDLVSASHQADPHAFYARLRDESPAHRVRLPDGQEAWLVTRYEDVAAVLKGDAFLKDRYAVEGPEGAKRPWMPAFTRPLSRNMLDLDGADHARLRALVSKAFTTGRVEALRDRIGAVADRLLDEALARPRFDLIRDFARPIPTTIIAEMIGVPAEDRHRFGRWSRAIVSAGSSKRGMARAVPNLWLFLRYIRKLVRARRADPREDLVGALVQVEEAGERLSEDELLAMIFLLLVAGHETTVNLIGNGVLALLRDPEALERLRSDPGLIRPAVEELLRFDGPLETATERYARHDLTIADQTIPRGALVFAVLASANRDERQFADPDRLDLAREPNRHLAFGLGPHYCLGAPLARLEGQVAIATLLRRAGGIHLAVEPGALRWRRELVLRGLESLPVRVGRRGG